MGRLLTVVPTLYILINMQRQVRTLYTNTQRQVRTLYINQHAATGALFIY